MTRQFLRRLAFASLVWLLLTGDAIIKCSSNPGGFDLGNRPPTAADSFFTVAASGSLTGFMKATDPDGDRLSYRIVAQPRIGTLSDVDTATGQFTYIPAEVGTDSFSFRANDGRQDSNTAVVTIQILDAAGDAAAKKPSGVLQVADDPAMPGAMIVLWDDPKRTLQRVYRGLAVEPGRLAVGLSGFALDPLRPDAMLGYRDDGSVVATEDGGRRWRPGPQFSASCVAAGSPRPGPCPRLPDKLPAPTGAYDTHGRASLLADRSRAGGWWLAFGDRGTRVFYSRDDGLRWKLVMELDITGLRLADCDEQSLCLLEEGGNYLWRFPAGR